MRCDSPVVTSALPLLVRRPSIETLAGAYVSTEFQASIAFLIIIVVLAIRPEGLLGKREVTKV